MPRQPAVPHEDLIQLLLQYKDQVVDSHGSICGPTAAVWKEIALKLNNTLKVNYLYTFLKENRHDSQVKLGIVKSPSVIDVSMDESNDTSINDKDATEFDSLNLDESLDCTSNIASIDAKSLVQPKKTFKVLFSPQEWEVIKPKYTNYKRTDRPAERQRMTFPQHEWANVLVAKLWEDHKLPCPYTITRGQIASSEGTEYCKIKASCKECGATARGVILCAPIEGESVVLLWRAPDTTSVPHLKCRQLSGYERKVVGSKLQRNCASNYRTDMAQSIMDQGDVKPPTLWSNEVLRKAKQEVRTEELGIKGPKDPVLNLSEMKHTTYAGSIHDIGMDKFFAHYFTTAQLYIYKKFAKYYTKLSIDATGGVVKALDRPNNQKSGHLFLYEGVSTTILDNKAINVPACQMVSEKHDTNSIAYWLNEWRRAGAPLPNEVVVDGSAALKSAVCKVFAKVQDLNTYKNICFNFLTIPGSPLPCCFIRLDVAHFMNLASKWTIWTDKAVHRTKNFYLRCLGLMLNSTKFEEFTKIFKAVLVVALSPCEKDEFQRPLPMEDYLTFLGRLLTDSCDNAILPIQEKANDGLELPDLENDTEGGSALDNWIGMMRQNITSITQDYPEGRPNPYHSPDVADKFIQVTREFILWSNVMNQGFASPFDRGTSAPIEGEFANLKSRILKGDAKPLKVDTFMATHIKAIEGACRLADANPTRTIKATAPPPLPALHDQTEEEIYDLNLKENWRGLGHGGVRPKKTQYLTPMPGALLNSSKIIKKATNTLLKNGNTVKEITATDGTGTVFLIKNTCTFDSLCHLVANAYSIFECYRDQMAKSDNMLLRTAKSLAHDGAIKETYAARAEALVAVLEPVGQLNVPHTTRRRTLALEYDAYGNVGTLLKKLIEPHESLQVTCEVPTHVGVKMAVDPDSRILTNVGMLGLRESLQELKRCSECSLSFGPHIFVDTEFLVQNDFPRSNSGSARLYGLNEIPEELLLGNHTYKLSGVVHYSVNHYIAYCYRPQHWTEYNDLHKKEKSVKDTLKVWPSILMYVKIT